MPAAATCACTALAPLPTACASPVLLAGAQPTHRITWSGCLNSSRVLVYYGQRCGANNDQIQWTGVYTAERSTLTPISGCQSYYTDSGYQKDKSLGAAIFGTCGVAPSAAR